MVLILASCEKEEIVEPLQPPVRVIMWSKAEGKARIVFQVEREFLGTVYVENPFILGKPKAFRLRLIDTMLVDPKITKQSFIIIDYGRGHIIR